MSSNAAPRSAPVSRQALSVLFSSTFAFTVCFAIWTMFSVLGVPLKTELSLNETQFGLLIATLVLTGALSRVPSLYLMSYATSYTQFLVLALFVGLAGGTFAVGTPYVARWFPKSRQGMAMGV